MNSPATLVYSLCLATSVLCAALLLRAYARDRGPLLLWMGAGFSALAVANLLLVLDLLILPTVNLWAFRQMATGAAIALMVYGLLFEVDR